MGEGDRRGGDPAGAVEQTPAEPFGEAGAIRPPARAAAPRPRLRGLAVSAATRAAVLPDVPTAKEAGFPEVLSPNWFMLAAAVGGILGEAAIVERMNAAT